MSRVATKEEEEEIIAENRHTEVTSILKGITNSLNQNKSNEIISAALDKHTAAISGFAESIKLLPAPKVNVQQPQVNIDFNSLNEKADKIIEGQIKIAELLTILNKQKEYKMEFTRATYSDLIQSPITF